MSYQRPPLSEKVLKDKASELVGFLQMYGITKEECVRILIFAKVHARSIEHWSNPIEDAGGQLKPEYRGWTDPEIKQ